MRLKRLAAEAQIKKEHEELGLVFIGPPTRTEASRPPRERNDQ